MTRIFSFSSNADTSILTGGVNLLQFTLKGVKKGQKVTIFAFLEFTSAGTQTTITFLIERRFPTTSALMTDAAIAEALFSAAGSTEQRSVIAEDEAQTDDPTYGLAGVSGVAAGTARFCVALAFVED